MDGVDNHFRGRGVAREVVVEMQQVLAERQAAGQQHEMLGAMQFRQVFEDRRANRRSSARICARPVASICDAQGVQLAGTGIASVPAPSSDRWHSRSIDFCDDAAVVVLVGQRLVPAQAMLVRFASPSWGACRSCATVAVRTRSLSRVNSIEPCGNAVAPAASAGPSASSIVVAAFRTVRSLPDAIASRSTTNSTMRPADVPWLVEWAGMIDSAVPARPGWHRCIAPTPPGADCRRS